MQRCDLALLKALSVDSRDGKRCRPAEGDYSRFFTRGKMQTWKETVCFVGSDWSYRHRLIGQVDDGVDG